MSINKKTNNKKSLKTFVIIWEEEREFKMEIEAEDEDAAMDNWWNRLIGIEEPYIRSTLAADEMSEGVVLTSCRVPYNGITELNDSTVEVEVN
jgi:hypothetical protein